MPITSLRCLRRVDSANSHVKSGVIHADTQEMPRGIVFHGFAGGFPKVPQRSMPSLLRFRLSTNCVESCVKPLIILLAMLGTIAGAVHSWHMRGLLVEAALLSEGFSLSAPVKLRVADFFSRQGILPAHNSEIDLPPAKSLFGTSVRRIAVIHGGVLMVDFQETIGAQTMMFTPSVSPVSGLLTWKCTSDSIDPAVLDMLKPSCALQPASDGRELMYAIANNNGVAVDSLLAAGTSPDILVGGNTPLRLAASSGDSTIVESLLIAGADVDNPALSAKRHSPLMVAIINNNHEAAAMLLDHGANVNHLDYRGLSAMEHAVITDQRQGSETFGDLLSMHINSRIEGTGDLAIREVVDQNAEEKRLRKLYAEYLGAANTCHVQRISSLLAQEGELGSNEMVNGVPLAENFRKPECSTLLHDHLRTKRSYLNASRAYLVARIQRCDATGVSRALADNPDLDVTRRYSGKTPIEISVSSGCYDVLRLMVRNQKLAGKLKEDIIVQAITQAPQEAMLKVVGNLIAADANINGVDRIGQSPLPVAIAMEQPVVAKYLLDAGAAINQKTSNGSYPVIEATKKGYEHLVLQMVAKGADLNARDSLGRTALFAAINRGQRRLVQSLILAGADIRVTDNNGINLVALAESQDLKTIKSMLTASVD
ncbi:MAG: ankyrin repeat domain-containing protein [Granulosicoccus sp.]